MSGCFAISLCAFGTDVKSLSPIASGDYSASRLAAVEGKLDSVRQGKAAIAINAVNFNRV
jgi:hypothetical protein